jgi:outer membrane protein assembly factor BamB
MVSRREVLAGAGGVAGVGALGVGVASQVRTDGLSAVPPAADTWPMTRYDAANTGRNGAAELPSDPSVAWTTNAVVPDPQSGTEEALEVVVGPDRVYANGATLAAIDRRDGTIRWESARTADALAVVDGTVYAGLEPSPSGPQLGALDATDGTVRWRTSLPGPPYDLVAGEDTLVFGAERTAVAVGTDGERLWRHRPGNEFDRPAIHDGSLYLSSHRLRRYPPPSLLDAALGDRPGPAWRTGAFDQPSAPAIDDDLAVAVSRFHIDTDGGAVVAIVPEDGSVRWSALRAPESSPDEPTIVKTSAPVLTNGLVVVRTAVVREDRRAIPRVDAFSTADGSLAWRHEDLGHVRRVVGVGDAVVAVGGDGEDGGLVTALDAAAGDVRWQVALDDPVTAAAAVDGAVVVATAYGAVATLR